MARYALILISLFAYGIEAADLFIVDGHASGAPLSQTQSLLYTVETTMMNRSDTAASIQLLGVSNGVLAGTDNSFTIPAGQSVGLQRAVFWRPVTGDPLWVLHVRVPDHVLVENSLRIGFTDNVGVGFQAPSAFGTIRLPIIRALIEPGNTQVHLATDLGRDQPSRVNVAIYNSGAAVATAAIEVRSHCDNALLESRIVTIPPDTLRQFGGFAVTTPVCEVGPAHIYTTVVVDQPSFSFVSILSVRDLPLVGFAIGTAGR